MKYLHHDHGDYHAFRLWDEDEEDDQVGYLSRAELVAALHEIDLHSRTVMADEIDEDPGALYVPAPGTCVRVVEVCEFDPTPVHEVGDVVRVGSATCRACHGNWLYLSEDSKSGVSDGTWCKVVRV
jgi:hypothetical protein